MAKVTADSAQIQRHSEAGAAVYTAGPLQTRLEELPEPCRSESTGCLARQSQGTAVLLVSVGGSTAHICYKRGPRPEGQEGNTQEGQSTPNSWWVRSVSKS